MVSNFRLTVIINRTQNSEPVTMNQCFVRSAMTGDPSVAPTAPAGVFLVAGQARPIPAISNPKPETMNPKR
jgi:hypothetical protein